MSAGEIIYYQPHLMSKILYEFGGLSSKTAIAFKKDTKIGQIIENKFFHYYGDFIKCNFLATIHFNNKAMRISSDVMYIYSTYEDFNELEQAPINIHKTYDSVKVSNSTIISDGDGEFNREFIY